ncbi:MAG: DUF4890 domain-containing protein, partial [Prevotella sp.]
MKRIILAVAAVFVMSAAAQAQCSDHKEGKQCKKEQMIQSRTDRMVKRYGLDEEQAKKLKELNEEYAGLMPMRPAPRPGCKGQACPDQQAGKGCDKQPKMDGAPGATNRRPCQEKADCEKMQKERMKAHKAYDEKLRKILGSPAGGGPGGHRRVPRRVSEQAHGCRRVRAGPARGGVEASRSAWSARSWRRRVRLPVGPSGTGRDGSCRRRIFRAGPAGC